ncbi:hypothetical protein MLD38_019983 [Melastoma candidum]|uniref:Uncharacterized protein n=1 Tax=Melastoma candidum TaxID=119954 RepID=A0ACB9QBV7_9MYRT|nr:hypothetical protein MLD38_019983 [Melastoma candidum]
MATSPAGAATLRLTARRRDPTVALHVDAACRGFACASDIGARITSEVASLDFSVLIRRFLNGQNNYCLD